MNAPAEKPLQSGVLTSPADPLLAEAIARTLRAPAADRAALFTALVRDIEAFMAARPQERPWTCRIHRGTEGSAIFRGGVGHSLVIDPDGRLWRARSHEDFETTYVFAGGSCDIDTLTPIYAQMREYLPARPAGGGFRFRPIPRISPMNTDAPLTEYLVISRGQWDASASKEDIQRAIDAFYAWHERMVAEGRSRRGSRLMKEGKIISRRGVVDGPYSEAKEVIGGYWSVFAHSLDEAAQLLAQNPCLACGLVNEVRELDPAPGSAFAVTAETPASA